MSGAGAAELVPYGGFAVPSGAVSTPAPATASQATVEGTWTSRARERDDGTRRVQLSMELDDETGNWGWGVDPADLDGLTFADFDGDVDDARFELTREAGTMVFVGRIRDGRGAGSFTFTPDASWGREMAALGYDMSDRRVLQAAIHDIRVEYARDLRDLGYDDLGERDLFAFAIHGVSATFIRAMNDLGYRDIPPRDLITMRIHGVTPEWVRQVRAAMGG